MKEQLIELTQDMSQSKLYNEDLAPTTLKQRTWKTHNLMALWVGMSFCIPTFMLASSLVSDQIGMNWLQAIITIFIGNAIVLIPMLLNGHPGTKYGIPFPVMSRAAFGTVGANIPAIMRALVACGWFGIQTFIGGAAVNAFLGSLIPGWLSIGGDFSIVGLTLTQAITFIAFWFLQMWIIFRGMDAVKKLETYAAPVLMIYLIILFIWAVAAADGFGPIVTQSSGFSDFGSFFAVFIPSLTGMIGFWATLSLNIPDFTRYGKSHKDVVVGQSVGLPVSMGLISFLGVMITSATVVIYGEALWDPSMLMLKFTNPIVLIISLIVVVFATITTNIAANVVSPANSFSNIAPKSINFKTGALITGIIGIVIMPWKLMSSPKIYIFDWLNTYAAFLGPVAAILIADYFIVRKKTLSLVDLYSEKGQYTYTKGFNINAIIAMVIGIFFAIIGKIIPSIAVLAGYGWFIGFALSFVIYILLMGAGKGVAVNVEGQTPVSID